MLYFIIICLFMNIYVAQAMQGLSGGLGYEIKKQEEVVFASPESVAARVAGTRTELMKAVMAGDSKQVDALLSTRDARGAGLQNIDAQDYEGKTALSWAVTQSNPEMVSLLLKHGVAINRSDAHGFTPLMHAVENDDTVIVDLLLDAGAQINPELTPLMRAVLKKNHTMVTRLLNAHAQVNAQDTKGNTALMYAARLGDKEIITELLKAGAVATIKNKEYKIATDFLSDERKQELGEFINGWKKRSMALMNAANQQYNLKTIEALMAQGADVNMYDATEKATALGVAVVAKQYKIVRFLLAVGADVNKKVLKTLDATALILAAGAGDEEMLKILLDAHALVDLQTKEGNTALMIAVQKGHKRAVELLLARGADVNSVNEKNGLTPLIMAASLGHLAIVKLLLNAGADARRVGLEGDTALIWALHQPEPVVLEIALLLLAAGVPVNHQNKEGGFALLDAAYRGYSRFVKLLLSAGAAVNMINEGGGTPLIYAAQEGRADTVQLLLEHGADTKNIRNWEERKLRETALDIAIRRESVEQNSEKRERYKAIIAMLKKVGAPTRAELEAGESKKKSDAAGTKRQEHPAHAPEDEMEQRDPKRRKKDESMDAAGDV